MPSRRKKQTTEKRTTTGIRQLSTLPIQHKKSGPSHARNAILQYACTCSRIRMHARTDAGPHVEELHERAVGGLEEARVLRQHGQHPELSQPANRPASQPHGRQTSPPPPRASQRARFFVVCFCRCCWAFGCARACVLARVRTTLCFFRLVAVLRVCNVIVCRACAIPAVAWLIPFHSRHGDMILFASSL